MSTRKYTPRLICKNPKCGKKVNRQQRGDSEYCTQRCERETEAAALAAAAERELRADDLGIGDGFSDL